MVLSSIKSWESLAARDVNFCQGRRGFDKETVVVTEGSIVL